MCSRTETRDEFGNTFFSKINVRAMEPAEPEVPTAAAPARAKDFDYTLDVSQVPDLKEWAETKLRPEMDKWYPIFRDLPGQRRFHGAEEVQCHHQAHGRRGRHQRYDGRGQRGLDPLAVEAPGVE